MLRVCMILGILALTGILGGAAMYAAQDAGQPAKNDMHDQGQVDRWNLYVFFHNETHEFFRQEILKDYFRVAGEMPEVNQKHTETRFILDFSGKIFSRTKKLLKSIDEIQKMHTEHPFSADLDKAAAVAAEKMQRIILILQKVGNYYNNKDYVDDNFKKGQEVHTEALEAVKNLNDILGAFRAHMDKEDKERRKREVAHMRAQGLEIRPLMLDLMEAAFAVRQNLIVQRRRSKSYENFDVAAYRADYDRLSRMVSQFTALAADTAKHKAEGLSSSRLSTFLDVLQDVKRNAASAIERATTESMKGGSLGGEIESLARNNNRLVEAYNHLQAY